MVKKYSWYGSFKEDIERAKYLEKKLNYFKNTWERNIGNIDFEDYSDDIWLKEVKDFVSCLNWKDREIIKETLYYELQFTYYALMGLYEEIKEDKMEN